MDAKVPTSVHNSFVTNDGILTPSACFIPQSQESAPRPPLSGRRREPTMPSNRLSLRLAKLPHAVLADLAARIWVLAAQK